LSTLAMRGQRGEDKGGRELIDDLRFLIFEVRSRMGLVGSHVVLEVGERRLNGDVLALGKAGTIP
jgi:hypothetical protein